MQVDGGVVEVSHLVQLLVVIGVERLERLDVSLQVLHELFQPCFHFFAVGILLPGPGQKCAAPTELFFGRVSSCSRMSTWEQPQF